VLRAICLDRGYDNTESRQLATRYGPEPHIVSRQQEIEERLRTPGWRARRWVVEAAHSFPEPQPRTAHALVKKAENHLALLQLAGGLIAFRKAHATRAAAALWR
jgi:hypothetical protein